MLRGNPLRCGWLHVAMAAALASCQTSPCPPDTCGETCRPLDTVRDCGGCDQACWGGMDCVDGSCACPPGQVICGGSCTDLLSSDLHCGECNVRCIADATCRAGSCTCPDGTQQCGDVCADVSTDVRHCGACDRPCVAGQLCEGGVCGCGTDEAVCSGRCIDVGSDPRNCGGCDVGCGLEQDCVGSRCTCPAGTTCGDSCPDVTSDTQHCGACGNACVLAGSTCTGGACVPQLDWVRAEPGGSRASFLDTALAAAPDGGVYAAWRFDERAGGPLVVARLGPDGTERWRRSVANAYPRALLAGSDRVIAATSGGQVVSLDDVDGATLFDTTIDAPFSDAAITPDGSVIVVGRFYGRLDLGAWSFTPTGSFGASDIFYARIDPSGEIVEARAYGGPDGEWGIRVAVAPDGDVWLAGSASGDGLDFGGATLPATTGAFVVRLSATGAHHWSTKVYDFAEGIIDIEALPDGVAVLGSPRYGPHPSMWSDLRLVVYERDFPGERWQTSFGSDFRVSRYASAAIATDLDTVYFTAGFIGTLDIGGGISNEGTLVRDLVFGALAATDGSPRWLATFGGADDDDGHAVVPVPSGVYVGGRFGGTVDFGGDSRTAVGDPDEDSFVARYHL